MFLQGSLEEFQRAFVESGVDPVRFIKSKIAQREVTHGNLEKIVWLLDTFEHNDADLDSYLRRFRGFSDLRKEVGKELYDLHRHPLRYLLVDY